MMMILRLQREKAETQMEAWQFKFLSEDKMVHDVEEMVAFEDSLYGREQVIQSLTCEVQAYKYRMMSYGLTYSKVKCLNGGYSRNQSISDFGGQIEYPSCAYHAPRCNLNDMKRKTDFEDDAINVEKYPSGEAPQSPAHLKNLEYRINRLERSFCSSQLDGVSGQETF